MPDHPGNNICCDRGAGVALLCQGVEVYGIGTIIKYYAQGLPDALFVCASEGVLTDWLRARGSRVLVAPILGTFTVGGSLATLARMPGVMRRARRDAVLLHRELAPLGVRVVQTQWLPQQLVAGAMRQFGYKSIWQINNNTDRRRLWGLG